MSHLLPPASHPARAMFDVADLVAVGTGAVPVEHRLYVLRRQAEAIFAASPAARRAVFFHVGVSDDQLRLVSFGRRGGHKREWCFGPIGRRAVLA